MTISFSKVRRRWRENPDYRNAYRALMHEFDLARELIRARTRAGLGQRQVAERMGTTQPSIARLEAGHKPSLRTLERFAEATASRLVIRLRRRTDAEARGNKPEVPAIWLRTSETDDLLCSLEHCLEALEQALSDSGQWKWAIISMHSAVQAAMVCHLTGTAELGALDKRCAERWLDWHERDGAGEIEWEEVGLDEMGVPGLRLAKKSDAPPQERLADFMTLYDRVVGRKDRIEKGAESSIGDDRKRRSAIERLTRLRNGVTHFAPKSWSIELAGLPGMLRECVGLISEISEDPWPFRHASEAWLRRLAEVLDEIREVCADLDRVCSIAS
jgi:transcriptional regulator with XRE-family HTH domain